MQKKKQVGADHADKRHQAAEKRKENYGAPFVAKLLFDIFRHISTYYDILRHMHLSKRHETGRSGSR